MNKYTPPSIECPMPDKLSTALALPDTPNVGLSGDYVEVKRKGPELYSRLVKIMTKPLPFFLYSLL